MELSGKLYFAHQLTAGSSTMASSNCSQLQPHNSSVLHGVNSNNTTDGQQYRLFKSLGLLNSTASPGCEGSLAADGLYAGSGSGGVDVETPEPPTYVLGAVSFFYVIIFITGVLGNSLVILVVWRNKEMRNYTNCLLLSLSMADLLVIIICMPTSCMDLYTKEVWHLGPFMCKLVPFLENAVASSSVLTILAISVERYYAICLPLKAQYKCSFPKMLRVVIAIWTVAMAACSPFLQFTIHKDSTFHDGTPIKVCRTYVIERWHRVYLFTLTAVFFVLPFVLLSTIYGLIAVHLTRTSVVTSLSEKQGQNVALLRARRRVATMLFTVVVLFFTCHIPVQAVRVWSIVATERELIRLGFEGYLNVIYFARVMFYLNSACNPFCYNMFSTKFREAFRRAFRCKKVPINRSSSLYSSRFSRIDTSHRRLQSLGSGASMWSRTTNASDERSSQKSASKKNVAYDVGNDPGRPLKDALAENQYG